MADLANRWPSPERPFSLSRQSLVRRIVIFAATVLFLAEVAGDLFMAFHYNNAQKATDAALAGKPVTRYWLKVTLWPGAGSGGPDGGGGSLESLVEGLPAHCGVGRALRRDGQLEVLDWCSHLLIDPNAITKSMKECKSVPFGAYSCSEGWVGAVVAGNRISFGTASGTYGWFGLLLRVLSSKVRLLVVAQFALVIAIAPLFLMDFLYGREQAA